MAFFKGISDSKFVPCCFVKASVLRNLGFQRIWRNLLGVVTSIFAEADYHADLLIWHDDIGEFGANCAKEVWRITLAERCIGPKSDALRGCYCKAEAKAKRKLAARQKAKAKPKELLRDKLKSSNLLDVERS